MSKELEIKCPSGSTLLLTGEDVDNPKLLQAVEEYKKTFYGENFYEFDLFEKQPKMKKQYSSKQRKIRKLKRENVALGQKRSSLIERNKIEYGVVEGLGYVPMESQYWTSKDLKKLSEMSFKIGKNSAKIQRLRTQIQQSKSLNTSEE